MSTIVPGSDTCTTCHATHVMHYPGTDTCWTCHDKAQERGAIEAWELAEMIRELIEIEGMSSDPYPMADMLTCDYGASPLHGTVSTFTDRAGQRFTVTVTPA